MNEQFIFVASSICLLFGLLLCGLPARRYFQTIKVEFAGVLFLVFGVVLMTTFKWTEVAIKISGLEVKLSEAQRDAGAARFALLSVQNAVSPEVKKQSLQAVLANYERISNSEPSQAQVDYLKQAIKEADVTIVPVGAFSDISKFTTDGQSQKK